MFEFRKRYLPRGVHFYPENEAAKALIELMGHNRKALVEADGPKLRRLCAALDIPPDFIIHEPEVPVAL